MGARGFVHAKQAYCFLCVPPELQPWPDRFSVCTRVGCVCVCLCNACRGQKETLDPLELELQMVMSYLMWTLGVEFGSSAKAVLFFFNS